MVRILLAAIQKINANIQLFQPKSITKIQPYKIPDVCGFLSYINDSNPILLKSTSVFF
jgi:hypothetical protein